MNRSSKQTLEHRAFQGKYRHRHFALLRLTLLHEFGHVVVGQEYGFPGLCVTVRKEYEAITGFAGGLRDLTGKLNQNFLFENMAIAIAGVSAELLQKEQEPSVAFVEAAMKRHSNRGDNELFTAARSKALRLDPSWDGDVANVVANVASILRRRLPGIAAAALVAAEYHLSGRPPMPYRIPDHIVQELLERS